MAKKERKLTSAEAKRKELFEAKAQNLLKQGYKKKDLTISVVTANVMAVVVMLPAVILFCWLYFRMNGGRAMINFDFVSGMIFLISVVMLTVIHEGIHGITWAFFSENHFHDIEFGFIWHMLTPYCTCKSALTKRQYIIGALMPTIIVGIIPAIIAIIYHYDILFLLSLLMIIGGGGDTLIVLKLLFYKENGRDSIYMDHPYECGIVVFEHTN